MLRKLRLRQKNVFFIKKTCIYYSLSSVAIISFYIFSKSVFLKRKRFSDVRVASITKKEYCFAVHFF